MNVNESESQECIFDFPWNTKWPLTPSSPLFPSCCTTQIIAISNTSKYNVTLSSYFIPPCSRICFKVKCSLYANLCLSCFHEWPAGEAKQKTWTVLMCKPQMYEVLANISYIPLHICKINTLIQHLFHWNINVNTNDVNHLPNHWAKLKMEMNLHQEKSTITHWYTFAFGAGLDDCLKLIAGEAPSFNYQISPSPWQHQPQK